MAPVQSTSKASDHPLSHHPTSTMARFTLNRLDELGFPYPVWESDDMDEARDQLDSLMGFLDEAIQPRSGQLEEMISDLKGQIDEAEQDLEEC